MTIVLPYRNDVLNGTELLYALRSIDKFLYGFTNLIIIGKPPDWYNGEWVPEQDHPGRKQFTIYNKLLTACDLREVSDSFIMWNDDHFLLQELQVNQIHNWFNGTLQDELNRPNIYPRYYNTVRSTLQIFPEGLNYDIHTPCIYKKDYFKMIFCNKTEEICVKSYYFNWFNQGFRFMKDLKIDSLLSKEAILELIKDRLFFSTSTNGIKKPMIELLNELYPNKSRWEK